jgi:hypothetical protein
LEFKSIFFIGIIEENEMRSIFNLSEELFLLSNYKIIYKNKTHDVMGVTNGNIVFVIFDFIRDNIKKLNFSNFYFDIVIHSLSNSNDNLLCNDVFKSCKICILNSDDENWIQFIKGLDNPIVITYGFNSKSTLTISSHNINQQIEANLYLQREITPLSGERLEPFEFSLVALSNDKEHIYPILAASALNLLLGDGILSKKPYAIVKLKAISWE